MSYHPVVLQALIQAYKRELGHRNTQEHINGAAIAYLTDSFQEEMSTDSNPDAAFSLNQLFADHFGGTPIKPEDRVPAKGSQWMDKQNGGVITVLSIKEYSEKEVVSKDVHYKYNAGDAIYSHDLETWHKRFYYLLAK